MNCGIVFTTIEGPDLMSAVLVRRNDALEPFQRDKLLLSIYDALRHRKDAVEAATALTATIVAKVLGSLENAQVSRAQIVQITTMVLKNFDNAAYVQYDAFHPL